MKDQILKIAKVKDEKSFYKKFPTEEAFMKAHGKAFKKAEMGSKMVNTQLHQLTDFGNPPIAQNGINFSDLMTNAGAKNAGMSAQAYTAAQQKQQQAPASGGGLGDMIGQVAKMAPQIMDAIGKNGKKLKKALDGGNPPIAQKGGKYNKYLQGLDQSGLNPDGTLKQVGDAFHNADTASYAGQQLATQNASQFATPSADKLLGKNDINSGADAGADAGGFDYAGAAMGAIGAAPQIIAGFQKIGQQNDDIKKANQSAQVSQVTASAAESRPEQMKRKYVRPEDQMVQPGQLGNPQGSGTNFLSAANGTMIGGNPTQVQNTYAPTGDLYGDLGYEPLNDSNPKQFAYGGGIHKAEFGDYFQDSGQAEIGGAAGQAIGNMILPGIGGQVGKLLGNVAGNLLGGADDMNKLHRYQDATQQNTQRAAFASGANALHAQNSANMEDGGWMSHDWQPQVITHFGDMDVSQVHSFAHQGMDSLRAGGHLKEYTPPSAEAMFTGRPDMALGGELQSHWGGGLETLSQNPYDASEIIMPKGNSHDESDGKGRTGIGITYGKNPVEVERNEPMVKMQDGGNQNSLVVFGNMIEDESGKKYKVLAKDIANSNNKQTKIKDKATANASQYQGHTPYDQFKMNSAMATLTGADMKLQQNSMKLKDLAGKQNAILDTAEEHGLDSDSLAKGKIKQAKKGANIPKAQDGQSYLNGRLLDPKDPRDAALIKENLDDAASTDAQIKAHFANKQQGITPIGMSKFKAPQVAPLYEDAFPSEYVSNGIQPVSGNGIGAQAIGVNQPSFFTPTTETAQAPTSSGYKPGDSVIGGVDLLGNYTGPQDAYSDISQPNTGGSNFGQKALGALKTAGKYAQKGFDKYGPTVLSNIAPFLRPTNQRPLDPSQTYPEMMALALNQPEAVKAQTFQPMLQGQPSRISLQDQINTIDSQTRAAIRAMGDNPAAQAQIQANAIDAKNRVLGEQFRMNQGAADQTYAANRATLNDAQLKNLQILDNQYTRQSEASSKTKQQAIEIAKSLAAKKLQNQMENRDLAIKENLYNYRFSPSGVAYNVNDPYQFNLAGTGNSNSGRQQAPAGFKFLYDAAGNVEDMKKEKAAKSGAKLKARNGAIVKAMKSL
jgi:hypothetical protein